MAFIAVKNLVIEGTVRPAGKPVSTFAVYLKFLELVRRTTCLYFQSLEAEAGRSHQFEASLVHIGLHVARAT